MHRIAVMARLLDTRVTVDTVLEYVRDKQEQIDLLDLTKKPVAASAPAGSAPAAG